MGDITKIGLDQAKSVFQVHAIDEAGRVMMGKRRCDAARSSRSLSGFRRALSASKPARRRIIGRVS
jgi:hypothetical protein